VADRRGARWRGDKSRYRNGVNVFCLYSILGEGLRLYKKKKKKCGHTRKEMNRFRRSQMHVETYAAQANPGNLISLLWQSVNFLFFEVMSPRTKTFQLMNKWMKRNFSHQATHKIKVNGLCVDNVKRMCNKSYIMISPRTQTDTKTLYIHVFVTTSCAI